MIGKTIIELIQAFTERGITRRTWNGSTSIVDQNVSVDNVLSNPHRNNGVSKVLGILLSDFVSRGPEHSLWRHQCQRKASAVSGRHICTVWHSAGISGKCRDIGIDISGIAVRLVRFIIWYLIHPGRRWLSNEMIQVILPTLYDALGPFQSYTSHLFIVFSSV